MSEKEVLNLNSEDLEDVSGGKSNTGKISNFASPISFSPMVGGEGSVWKPKCPGCGKVMLGGEGVIRINKKGAESPYFCTECAEKFLNSGDATIDPGYEDLYEKYEKSMNETTGEIWYGWKKKPE